MVNLLMLRTSAARVAVACIIGYLLGCSNMAYYLGKYKKVNLREGGSGNLGTSNATALLGLRAGLLTAAHDILKTVAAMWIVEKLFPETPLLAFTAGTSAVLGHIYPFYLKFHGGKGFAAFLGMTLYADPPLFFVMTAATAVITVLSDHIVYGTFTVVVSYPVILALTGRGTEACIALAATVCIIWSHRENIARLRAGTEIGLRQALDGEYRLKK